MKRFFKATEFILNLYKILDKFGPIIKRCYNILDIKLRRRFPMKNLLTIFIYFIFSAFSVAQGSLHNLFLADDKVLDLSDRELNTTEKMQAAFKEIERQAIPEQENCPPKEISKEDLLAENQKLKEYLELSKKVANIKSNIGKDHTEIKKVIKLIGQSTSGNKSNQIAHSREIKHCINTFNEGIDYILREFKKLDNFDLTPIKEEINKSKQLHDSLLRCSSKRISPNRNNDELPTKSLKDTKLILITSSKSRYEICMLELDKYLNNTYNNLKSTTLITTEKSNQPANFSYINTLNKVKIIKLDNNKINSDGLNLLVSTLSKIVKENGLQNLKLIDLSDNKMAASNIDNINTLTTLFAKDNFYINLQDTKLFESSPKRLDNFFAQHLILLGSRSFNPKFSDEEIKGDIIEELGPDIDYSIIPQIIDTHKNFYSNKELQSLLTSAMIERREANIYDTAINIIGLTPSQIVGIRTIVKELQEGKAT